MFYYLSIKLQLDLSETRFPFSHNRLIMPRPDRVYGMCNRRVAYVHKGLP